MWGLMPNWAVYFTVYDNLKTILGHMTSRPETEPFIHIASAMVAGAVTNTVVTPFWVAKTRLITQITKISTQEVKYTSTLNTIYTIFKEEGMAGLYSGFIPSLLGLTHVAIQFPLYEHFKLKLAEKNRTTPSQLSSKELIIASSVSKIIASIIAYPHEVVRSRLQNQHRKMVHPDTKVINPEKYDGLIDAIKKIISHEGIGGLYRGMGTNLLRVTPACAITFTSFELILRYLTKTINVSGR